MSMNDRKREKDMFIVKSEKTGNTFNMGVSKVQKLGKKWIERLIGFECYLNEGREESPISLRECLDLAINGDERFLFFLGIEDIKFTEKDEFVLNFLQYHEKELGLNLDLHFMYKEVR